MTTSRMTASVACPPTEENSGPRCRNLLGRHMGMLVVAAFAGAGSGRADSAPVTGAPALRIAARAYSVFTEAYLYRHGHRWQRLEDVDGVSGFGRLAADDNRANRSAALEYAVEGHRDPSAYRHCYELGCYDVLWGPGR